MPSPTAPRPVPLQPLSLGSAAGWLHGGRAETAVVIAGSLGLEMLTTQRFVRLMADTIAARGAAVVRFDWTGSGDSLGDAPDLDACRHDLDAAIEAARTRTDATRIVLVGLRFGALIAAARAAEPDIAALAVLAPPGSGRQFVRELRGLARLVDAALPPPPGGRPAPVDGDGLTAAGFVYPAPFLAALHSVVAPDLAARGASLDTLVLRPTGTAGPVIDFGLPADAITRHDFTGYERMMVDPTAGEVAVGAIETVAAWVLPEPVPAAPSEPVAAPALLATNAFREERVQFGPGGRLVGVWCEPAGGARRAAVFADAGGIPHSGWARMTVAHARRLAGAGVASLRFDFAELGDSAEAASGPRQGLYEAGPREDLAAALDVVTAHGHTTATVVGACSGAHHAFGVAQKDRRVSGLVLVNILCFVWGPSYALQLSAWAHARVAGADIAAAASRSVVARVTAPLLDRLRPIAKVGLRWATEAGRRLAALPTALAVLAGRPAMGPVERGFRTLVARGTWIALVSAVGDDSLIEIARHLGPDGARVADLDAVTLDLIPAADHVLTPPHARAALGDLLVARLGGDA
jgi:predicted alpha/beta hydrolase